MKKILKFLSLLVFIGNIKAQTPNFTVTSSTGSFSLSCAQTSLNLTASTVVNPPVSFHWQGATFSLTGSNVTISQPGTYTVTVLDSLNMVFGTQYITVTSNTVVPSSTVSPASQSISCGTPVGAQVTSNASGNVTHLFLSPFGGTVIINSAIATYTSLGVGTYTHILMDNVTGCTSSSTFTFTSSQGFPTFSVTSAQNFTLGCNSKSVATINFINANTSPTLGGPVSFSLMYLYGGVLNPIVGNTITIPGIYYAIVKDNISNCATQVPISIISNTNAPNISASVPNQILSCDSSQVLLHGNTTTSNTSMSWSFIGTPGTMVGSTVLALSNTLIPTTTLVNVYTLTITDLNSTCKSTSIIPIYQNLFPPKAVISSSSNSLTCLTPSVVLVNQSSSNIPPGSGFPTNYPVIGYLWEGPLPQPNLTVSSTYTAFVPGIYTLTVKDLNNGCMSKTTAVVMDNQIYPGIMIPTGASLLPCPGSTTINAIIYTVNTNNTYLWLTPPGAIVNGVSTLTLTTNTPGDYTLTATNMFTGCSSREIYHVYACVGLASNTAIDKNIQIFPNPSDGLFKITLSPSTSARSVEVYNALGQLIQKENLRDAEHVISIQNENNGIYILHVIENGKTTFTTKIIKQ